MDSSWLGGLVVSLVVYSLVVGVVCKGNTFFEIYPLFLISGYISYYQTTNNQTINSAPQAATEAASRQQGVLFRHIEPRTTRISLYLQLFYYNML